MNTQTKHTPTFRVIEGCTKICADPIDHDGELYGVIQGPVFALDVYAAQGLPMEQFKATLQAFASNASSNSALKAENEALKSALDDLIPAAEQDFREAAQIIDIPEVLAKKLARINLARELCGHPPSELSSVIARAALALSKDRPGS